MRRLLSVAANPSIDKLAELERIESGAIHRLPPLVMVPGGKGLNVARAAATLGTPTTALALLAGQAGKWIADSLASYGVEVRYIVTTGETRSCLSIFERQGGVLTEFYEAAGSIAGENWSAFRQLFLTELDGEVTIATMSGSLPGGAPIDGYADLCAVAQSKNVRVLLDTSGPALEAALRAHPWLVKVNLEEAAEVTGVPEINRTDEASLAKALVGLGARNALVTQGQQGAMLVSSEGAWSIGATPVVGRYPVGSGDALLAGVAVRLLSGESLVEAARFGAAVAAANAQRPGAGVVDPNDVLRILGRIEIRALTKQS